MSLNIERLNDDIGYYERNLDFHKKLKADIESCELIQKLSAMPNLKVDIEYPNQGRNFTRNLFRVKFLNFTRNFVGYTVHFYASGKDSQDLPSLFYIAGNIKPSADGQQWITLNHITFGCTCQAKTSDFYKAIDSSSFRKYSGASDMNNVLDMFNMINEVITNIDDYTYETKWNGAKYKCPSQSLIDGLTRKFAVIKQKADIMKESKRLKAK